MKISNHRLSAEQATHVDSPNRGEAFAVGDLDTVIIHYTAGASVTEAVDILCNPGPSPVSAHLVVGREGDLTQLLPFNVIGWHAGLSSWGGREGFNRCSIGIEIVNAGQLERRGDRFASWKGEEFGPEEVVEAVHRHQTRRSFWHRFTAAQVGAVEELCCLLVREYGLVHILGHEEVAPERKIDPGPAYPLELLRSRSLAGSAWLENFGQSR